MNIFKKIFKIESYLNTTTEQLDTLIEDIIDSIVGRRMRIAYTNMYGDSESCNSEDDYFNGQVRGTGNIEDIIFVFIYDAIGDNLETTIRFNKYQVETNGIIMNLSSRDIFKIRKCLADNL